MIAFEKKCVQIKTTMKIKSTNDKLSQIINFEIVRKLLQKSSSFFVQDFNKCIKIQKAIPKIFTLKNLVSRQTIFVSSQNLLLEERKKIAKKWIFFLD